MTQFNMAGGVTGGASSGMPDWLMPSLFGATSLMQIGGALTAGKIAKTQSKLERKQLQLQLQAREADRKEALAKAMAAANAASGTKGIAAFEGSPLAVLEQMEKSSEKESQRDKYMTELAKTTEKYRGKQKALGYQSQAFDKLATSGIQFGMAG